MAKQPGKRTEPIVDFGFRIPSPAEPARPQPVAAAEPGAASVAVSEAFRAKAEQWKRELLDVTRRNRAINYRTSRATLTLPASPDDLWETLLVNEGAMTFGARNFAPDSSNPDEDTRATEAFTAASRLADRARLADREQGIQVLFAAMGWLAWIDPEGHELRSPLVLIPVELTYDRQKKELKVQAAADDPPEVNPSLTYLLQVQMGLRLPELEDAEGEPLHQSLDTFLNAAREVVARQAGWTIERDGAVVDVFAFAKLAMVDEIDHALGRMSQHPLLRALAGEEQLPVADIDDAHLDSRYAPGQLRTVVDADAYQLAAVGLAAAGGSFVIEGPPGTGKSQTITNIAAELMAQGKRVLFVAEKRVAREVVLENLQKAGLGEACLHLASNAGAANRADAKAQVIKEIVDTLDAGAPPPAPEAELPGRYAELRKRLNVYAEAMGAPLGEGGWTTAFDILGQAVSRKSDRRENIAIPSVAGKSRFWLEDAIDAAKSLDAFAADELALLASPWANLRWTSHSAEQEARLGDALQQLGSLETEVTRIAGPNLGAAGAPGALTVDAVEALATRLEGVATYRKKAKSFLRLMSPGYYAARGDYRRFLADGYAETKTEGAAATELRRLVTATKAALTVVGDAFGGAVFADSPATELSTWAQGLAPGVPRMAVLTEMAGVLAALERQELRPAVIALLADASTHKKLADVVPATVYGGWAYHVSQGDAAMTPEQHMRLVESFARLDQEMIGWARTKVLSEVRSRRPRSVNHGAMAPLVKYNRAKRRPALRTMLGNSREAVQLLKPCLLMSPLAAAQYLCHGNSQTYAFDTVIVDEASMIPTPDMVVALSLAKQAIIVGDSKQMPPTNFFNKEIGAVGDDATADEVTFESILDEAAPLMPSTMLRAHYRSRDEALIAFSNVFFYDGKLIAFPDAWGTRPESGVRFEMVEDAVYGRGKSRANPGEAKRAIEVLRSELEASKGQRHVAITAMSLAQQSEIVDQLEAAAAVDPIVRTWLDGGGLVRNLETVQGDESDVMILSVGYGKDEDGKFTLNLGPLGQEKGERRLNVAITRAKWKTVLVTSIHSGDIDASRTSATGTLRLKDYLDYAERGPVALPATAVTAGSPLTVFEQVVLEAAAAEGLQCVPRVGVGGYQVDIGVRHPTDPERFVLAIECDGPTYFGAPAARDRELGRHGVLKRMGWEVHRVHAAAWYRDPAAELNRLLERYRGVAI